MASIGKAAGAAVFAAIFAGSAFAQAPTSEGLSPREAGARYGQALGAGLACRDAKTTQAAENLGAKFAGADLDSFKAEAAMIVSMWRKSMACDEAREINMCRLMKERNCADALYEIGPNGSAVPGLLDKTE